jgi:hypothetical protein
VKYCTIRADPAFSHPHFLPAYEWLEDELGFYPLFCSAGRSESAIRMTGYQDNWKVWICSRFEEGKCRNFYRRKGEFPNLALLSFDDLDGVFMDYDYWHIALTACQRGDPVTDREKRMIFKPSWTKGRWIRAARDDTRGVQLVAPELPLHEASEVRVRNNATRRLLEDRGFCNVRVFRIRADP